MTASGLSTFSAPVLERSVDRRTRPDLDGLCGVAVMLVVVCHIWFGRVSGGIDVLLVLTGFVFGARVLRRSDSLSLRAETGWFLRRLVAPLVVVLAVSAVLTVLIQPQTRWEAFAEQTLASLGYYLNWQLITTAGDYVQASETVTPLQHLWVMSVQGQFFSSSWCLPGR